MTTVIDDKYVCTKDLGEGGSGYVKRATDLKANNRQVAIKFYEKSKHGDKAI